MKLIIVYPPPKNGVHEKFFPIHTELDHTGHSLECRISQALDEAWARFNCAPDMKNFGCRSMCQGDMVWIPTQTLEDGTRIESRRFVVWASGWEEINGRRSDEILRMGHVDRLMAFMGAAPKRKEMA